MKNTILLILVFFSAKFVVAQHSVSGKVTDIKTGEALAFVNIRINNSMQGSTTDIDGKFTVKSFDLIEKLTFTYVGYKEIIWINSSTQNSKINIQLQQNAVGLREVKVINKENPAHRIILKAVANKNKNNPDKQKSYRCKTYNKFVVTGVKNDSIKKINGGVTIAAGDSSEFKVDSFFEKQHLFLTESISERSYLKPDNVKETVLATRFSGLKSPVFSLLATQFQPFSFYDDYIGILDIKYLNPISKGSINKYLFILEDTTFNDVGDTVYVISFKPKKSKNFKGLEGLLYINSNKYAIQNVIAESADKNEDISIKIQQQYEWINNSQWFPSQLNTDIYFKQINSGNRSIMGIGRSYIKEIELNPQIKRRIFGNNIMEIKPDAALKDELFWNKYRTDSIDAKDRNTYHFMDSLGKTINLDRKVKWGMALLSGKFRTGYIDWDFKKIIDYNRYEDIRLGAGVETNDRISNFFTLNGYYAYGFGDKAHKYGGGLNLFLHHHTETFLSYQYSHDVMETGSVIFLDRDYSNPLEDFRKLSISRMESIEKHNILFSTAYLKNTTLSFSGSNYTKTLTIPYTYKSEDFNTVIENNHFKFTEITTAFRYAFNEKHTKFLGKKIITSTKYPVFIIQYTQAIKGILGGEYNYQKLDAKIDYTIRFRNLGKTSFQILGGKVFGDAPLINLYNARANFGAPLIFAGNSFNTMRINEFFSDEYISSSVIHSFGSLLYKSNHKKFKPELSITANAIWGKMNNPQQHQSITFNTLNKGYYEAGLVIDKIWGSLGAGVFYRIGYYSFKTVEENFAFKLALSTSVLRF